MVTNSDILTPRQQRAIAAILTARSLPDAALVANISLRTLRRWFNDSAFRAALLEAEGSAIDQATRRLLTLQAPAIEVLESTMAEGVNPAVRLRAAQSVLDYLLKLRELRNVEERLSALEASINVKRHR